jgi:3-oxosteroid 1-dehydrogenase
VAGHVTHDHEYDVVVLGTGAAGMTAAVRAAADGARVGLFERADTVAARAAAKRRRPADP